MFIKRSLPKQILALFLIGLAMCPCWWPNSAAVAGKLAGLNNVRQLAPALTISNVSPRLIPPRRGLNPSGEARNIRLAQASTINPTVPAQNSALASGPIRNNFNAAYNDVNNIYGLLPGFALVGSPNTFTAPQTFTNSDLLLLGSSTGYTTFTSANSGGSNYVFTIPAANGTAAISVTAPLALNATTGAVTWNIAQSLPTGLTATTVSNPADASAKIATDAFVQAANLLAMATVPMNITAGTYSFATNATVTPTLNHVASGGVITSATVSSGGAGVAVGDLFIVQNGNHAAIVRVETITGSAAATVSVVYGGTGYATATGVSTDPSSAIPYTYLLSGTLTNDVTIITTSGTYLNASQQWYFANNTTGGHTVTVCVSGGADTCSGGRTAVIPQGTANSRIVGVQTDGILNVDIASIVNAADLKGTTLASNVTGSSLTSVGTIGTGVWNGTPIAPAYGASTIFAPTAASSGSANAQTFAAGAPSTWTLTAGNTVCGSMSYTNTSTTTLAVNGTAVTAIKRRSTGGLTALAGGEIIAGQGACFLYDGTQYQQLTAIAGASETQAGNYTATALDGNGDFYAFTGVTPTLTLPLSTLLPNSWRINNYAFGGPLTVTPQASDSINGLGVGTSVTVPKGNVSLITTDGAGNFAVSGLALPLTALATQAANTALVNATAGAAVPTAQAMTSCSTANSGVNWTTSTGFGCNTALAALATADQTLSGGANLTTYSLGTKSSGTLTIDCGLNPAQTVLNGGAFTLAAPANDGHCLIQVQQSGTAGAITLSGFSTSPSSTGDTLATANTTSGTVTISIATPAVVTWTQTFVAGQAVYFTTSGALPTGIVSGTVYYVISTGLSGSSFEIAATPGGAAINTSGSQSGTQTGHEPAIFTANIFRVNGLSNLVWKQQQ